MWRHNCNAAEQQDEFNHKINPSQTPIELKGSDAPRARWICECVIDLHICISGRLAAFSQTVTLGGSSPPQVTLRLPARAVTQADFTSRVFAIAPARQLSDRALESGAIGGLQWVNFMVGVAIKEDLLLVGHQLLEYS